MEHNNNIDLDFTKPGAIPGMEAQDFGDVDAKRTDLKAKITSAENLATIALNSGDEAGHVKYLRDQEEFKATLADIDEMEAQAQSMINPKFKSEEVADMDGAFGGERANLMNRTDKWHSENPGKGLNSVGGDL